MDYVDVNDYTANIAQVVRGCPNVTLRRAYMRAYRELMQQSQWLRQNIPGVMTIGESQYSLGDDPVLDICGVFAVQLSQTLGGNAPQYWRLKPSNSSFWNPNVGNSSPTQFQYVPEGQVAVFPPPQEAYDMVVTAIMQPKEDAVNVPLSPLVKYSNEIEAGALAYLLQIPGQPWTDKPFSIGKAKEFSAGIANAKAEVQRGYNVGAQRARGGGGFGGGFYRGFGGFPG